MPVDELPWLLCCKEGIEMVPSLSNWEQRGGASAALGKGDSSLTIFIRKH